MIFDIPTLPLDDVDSVIPSMLMDFFNFVAPRGFVIYQLHYFPSRCMLILKFPLSPNFLPNYHFARVSRVSVCLVRFENFSFVISFILLWLSVKIVIGSFSSTSKKRISLFTTSFLCKFLWEQCTQLKLRKVRRVLAFCNSMRSTFNLKHTDNRCWTFFSRSILPYIFKEKKSWKSLATFGKSGKSLSRRFFKEKKKLFLIRSTSKRC